MRDLSSEPASSDVHLWSAVPDSVPPGYHKIRGWVKRNALTATFWGGDEAYVIVEMTICKLSYEFRRSLHCKICPHSEVVCRSSLNASASPASIVCIRLMTNARNPKTLKSILGFLRIVFVISRTGAVAGATKCRIEAGSRYFG